MTEDYYREYLNRVSNRLVKKGIDSPEKLKAYTNELVLQYKETKCPKIGEKIYNSVLAYVFYLYAKSPKIFCGYDLIENMGMVYEEVIRSAELYDAESGVPYHLYFGRRLWSKFSHQKNRETYFTDSDGVKRAKDDVIIFSDALLENCKLFYTMD